MNKCVGAAFPLVFFLGEGDVQPKVENLMLSHFFWGGGTQKLNIACCFSIYIFRGEGLPRFLRAQTERQVSAGASTAAPSNLGGPSGPSNAAAAAAGGVAGNPGRFRGSGGGNSALGGSTSYPVNQLLDLPKGNRFSAFSAKAAFWCLRRLFVPLGGLCAFRFLGEAPQN